MRVLVVYCHPVEDSLCSALHGAVLEGLTAAGHTVDDCDLYAEGFNPVLSREERRVYNTPGDNLREVGSYVDRVMQAEALVLVFPVWNFGLPAMLKGFIDRVLVPGVSFHIDDRGRIAPGLTHLRHVQGVATYGVPRWKAWWIGDAPRAMLHRFFRRITGGNARVGFQAKYDLNVAPRSDLERFVLRVSEVMKEVN
jgi:putative NADPH-quinone reductase